jgi:diguanylate cyclase (GGDEF)-like protein
MPEQSLRRNDSQGTGPRVCLPDPVLNGRANSRDRWKHPSDRDLEVGLSSALLASDTELGSVVHEIDAISEALKSDAPVEDSLRVAVHPAVWSAVRHVILERELRHLAVTDDLTCLYNRRGFFAAATQQLKVAMRKNQSMLLFFFDVDDLKSVNDSHGHREGDLALVRVADALEKAFRDSDILARLGGDEFAVMALETSPEGRGVMLRRLEKGLKKPSANESRYELSVSVGAARFDAQHAVTLGELMAQATQAMNEMKAKRCRMGHSSSKS